VPVAFPGYTSHNDLTAALFYLHIQGVSKERAFHSVLNGCIWRWYGGCIFLCPFGALKSKPLRHTIAK